MDASLLSRVKAALNAKYYTVNDSWLKDGVEFYVSEHGQTSIDAILKFIISQWQLCDLRDINNVKGCLPSNLAQQKCVTLPGKYILQMDYLYDISVSKYKQLEKIRNVSTENVEATEAENATQWNATQNPKSNNSGNNWEPKSKRMMQLKLTDGKQDVSAVEHKTIHFFDDTSKLLPGFKVMIKGPVTCRRGIILLEEHNIMPIGGEVESYLIRFAVENVFARALNMEENPNPYNDSGDSLSGLSRSDTNTTQRSITETVNQQHNRPNNSSRQGNSNRNISNHTTTVTNQPTSTTNANTVESMDDFFEDEFNEIDFNELDREVNRVSQEQALRTSHSSSQQTKVQVTNSTNIRNSSQSQRVERQSEIVNFDNHFDDQFDDQFDDNFEIEEIEKAAISLHKPATTRPNLPVESQMAQASKAPLLENDLDFEMDLTEDNWDNFKAPSKPAQKMNLQNVSKKQTEAAVSNINPKRTIDKVAPPKETNPAKLRRSEETLTNVRKITDFVQQKPNQSSLGIQFLCDILKGSFTTTPSRKKIRGKVVEVSKLNVDSQSLWSLNATLTDDTANIDVDFSSQALDKLFGFTAVDFKQKKKMKKQNPEIMISLRQDIVNAEQKITKLDALVELEFVDGKKPLVTDISELSAESKRKINEVVAKMKKS